MRGCPQWRWHLDEAFVKVNGKLCYLWRAVDHEGEVLEAVVTAKRDKAAALKFLKRIMKKYGRPRSVVTDGLCCYPAAMKEIGNADRQEAGRRLNNRAENSHQPFRRRERAMQRFRSMKTLQQFSSVHAQVHNHFNQERHLVTRQVLQTKALRRVGRVERPRGLIAAWVWARCAQRRRPGVALTKPVGGEDCHITIRLPARANKRWPRFGASFSKVLRLSAGPCSRRRHSNPMRLNTLFGPTTRAGAERSGASESS